MYNTELVSFHQRVSLNGYFAIHRATYFNLK